MESVCFISNWADLSRPLFIQIFTAYGPIQSVSYNVRMSSPPGNHASRGTGDLCCSKCVSLGEPAYCGTLFGKAEGVSW